MHNCTPAKVAVNEGVICDQFQGDDSLAMEAQPQMYLRSEVVFPSPVQRDVAITDTAIPTAEVDPSADAVQADKEPKQHDDGVVGTLRLATRKEKQRENKLEKVPLDARVFQSQQTFPDDFGEFGAPAAAAYEALVEFKEKTDTELADVRKSRV